MKRKERRPYKQLLKSGILENSERVQRLKKFKQDHNISQNLMADILSVDVSTMRKYMADPRANMHRNVSYDCILVVDLIDRYKLSIDMPVVQKPVDHMSAEDFAESINAVMSEKGLMLTELADFLGYHRTNLAKFKNGTYRVPRTLTKFIKLANIFGWPVDR